jgi:hypothetical protein
MAQAMSEDNIKGFLLGMVAIIIIAGVAIGGFYTGLGSREDLKKEIIRLKEPINLWISITPQRVQIQRMFPKNIKGYAPPIIFEKAIPTNGSEGGRLDIEK